MIDRGTLRPYWTSVPDETTAMAVRLSLAEAIGRLMGPFAIAADNAGLHRIAYLMHEITEEARLAHDLGEIVADDDDSTALWPAPPPQTRSVA